MIQAKIQNHLEIFTIRNDEIEGRLDPFFYHSDFIEIENRLEKIKYEKLKNICEDIKNGSTPPGGIFEDSGIPYFRSQDFNLFDFQIKQFINERFHHKIHRSSIKSGDVLLAVVGATLGVVGYVSSKITEGNINQNIARLRIKDKRINSEYLAIFLSSSYGQKQIHRQATVTTQAYLNNQQLGEIKIPIPPILTQNKIVSIVQKAYDEKRQKGEKAQKLFDSIDDYILGELGIKMPEVKDKITFVVESDEIENKRIDPKAYLEKPKAILKSIRGSKYKTKELSKIVIESIAGEWGNDPLSEENMQGYVLCNVLRNTNFDNQFNLNFDNVAQRLILENKVKKIKLKKGDILIEKSGGSPIQPVGRIALIENIGEDYTFSNFLQCFRINKKDCLPDYLFYYLKAIYGLGYMEYVQNQTTGIKNLIMEEYLSIPISLPSLEIQNKIAKEVRSRREKAIKLQQEAKEVLEKAKNQIEEMIFRKQ